MIAYKLLCVTNINQLASLQYNHLGENTLLYYPGQKTVPKIPKSKIFCYPTVYLARIAAFRNSFDKDLELWEVEAEHAVEFDMTKTLFPCDHRLEAFWRGEVDLTNERYLVTLDTVILADAVTLIRKIEID